MAVLEIHDTSCFATCKCKWAFRCGYLGPAWTLWQQKGRYLGRDKLFLFTLHSQITKKSECDQLKWCVGSTKWASAHGISSQPSSDVYMELQPALQTWIRSLGNRIRVILRGLASEFNKTNSFCIHLTLDYFEMKAFNGQCVGRVWVMRLVGSTPKW